jgi:hypothetical protein
MNFLPEQEAAEPLENAGFNIPVAEMQGLAADGMQFLSFTVLIISHGRRRRRD